MGGWWSRRSQVERFDLYTRWSLYLLLGLAPLAIAGTLASNAAASDAALATVMVASLAQAAVCLALIRTGIQRRQTPGPHPVALIAASAAVTLVGAALAVILAPEQDGAGWVAAVFFVVAFVAALSVVAPTRVLTLVVLGALAVPIGLSLFDPALVPADTMRAVIVSMLFGSLGAVFGFRASVWMLDVVWELDRARGVQARLAVAEERLRFSRDLHDVVGRGLSVVALKSDLAAQLAKRGRPEAADEMLEVRQVAQDLLAEVREVVRGYRTADLGAELAGARSVLASAGIDCRIIGDPEGLGEEVQITLGWVVREATTNVLRHSEASTCTIALRTGPSSAVLTMENDGARPAGSSVALGHGLLGLSERLTALGGTVTAERLAGQRFRLTAEVPVTGP